VTHNQAADRARQLWIDREALAEAMIPLIGRLYRTNNVVSSVYGRGLVNKSVVGLLKAHRFARHIADVELPLEETLPILQALGTLNLGAASLDLARLAVGYRARASDTTLDAYLREELAPIVDQHGLDERTSTDVVLYGFGRIGRLLARILIEHAGGGQGLRLRAIVVRKGSDNDIIKRASLLRRDSVHGPFEGTITVDEINNTILANGTLIQVIYSSDPASVDYTSYGIHHAVVVDNTGRWRDAEGLSQHLRCPGVSRVLLTAPGKGALKNIVHGINHASLTAARPTQSPPYSRPSTIASASSKATWKPCTPSPTTKTSSTTFTRATAVDARRH
jgi:glyceraldehyde 3-phosphate dehydrogenase